jgi:general secretion pathway protein L
MSECLVIRLDSTSPELASWVVADPTGALLGPPLSGPLAGAVEAAAGRVVIALAPAFDVVRTLAEVPLKGGGKLLQALPFALEEQLAEDVDGLHFAHGERLDDGRFEVAIVRRQVIEDWGSRLASAGLRADRMYSVADAVGSTPNTATLLLEEDCAILREADGRIGVVDAANCTVLLDLVIGQSGAREAETGRANLVVYATAQAVDRHGATLESLRPQLESLDIRQLTDGSLPRLAAQIVTTPGVNLLQGDYARRSTLIPYLAAWRQSAALAATLVALSLVLQYAEVSKLRSEVAALDSRIDQAFHYVFPDAGPVQDARAQLSSRLRQMGERGSAAPQEFLATLNIVAGALSGSPEGRIEAINYRSGTFELRVRAPNVAVLDQIQQTVMKSGSLDAQIQSANASGEDVIGRLQISRAGG